MAFGCIAGLRSMASKAMSDPASVAVSRRRRRAKTDAIDGETLLRTLLHGNAVSLASAKR